MKKNKKILISIILFLLLFVISIVCFFLFNKPEEKELTIMKLDFKNRINTLKEFDRVRYMIKRKRRWLCIRAITKKQIL